MAYGVAVDKKTTEKLIKDLCKLTQWQNEPSFPGSQVVTLSRASLGKLSNHDYYVAEKSDGTRLMMIIEDGKGYLVDRKCKAVLTNSCFPLPLNPAAPHAQHFHNGTVLDGEMLEEKDGDRTWLSYVVYDVVAINGVWRGGEKLYTRLQLAQTEVIEPRQSYLSEHPNMREQEKFELRLKPMYRCKDTRLLFTDIIPKLQHENDGVIFTPVDMPYKPGTCFDLLKWKPLKHQTIDFRVDVKFRQRIGYAHLNLADHGSLTFNDYMTLSDQERKEIGGGLLLSKINGKVIECTWDAEWRTLIPLEDGKTWEDGATTRQGGWRFSRFRPDRELPNDVSVFKRVNDALQEGLDEEELLAKIDQFSAEASSASGGRGQKRPHE